VYGVEVLFRGEGGVCWSCVGIENFGIIMHD